jgi:hypothetical protein
MHAEARLMALGLSLPAPLAVPLSIPLPFTWVRVHGRRAFISGHSPVALDGSLYTPRGKVGQELSEEEGYAAAKSAGLALLGSLKRTLGDLDRVTAWLRVVGYVNCAPHFNRTTTVINGCSDLILAVYGEEAGAHSRSAIGAANLPLDNPVIIQAEVEID